MPFFPISATSPARALCSLADLLEVKEARIEHVFRYAHVFPRCVAMLGSGAIDVSPLITSTYPFADSVHAFELASTAPVGQVKIQIAMPV